MWVKVSEVQVENQLVKGTLDNTPTEITHLTFGNIVFVPFKDIEDIWIEGQVPESVKRLLEIKEEELKAEESVRARYTLNFPDFLSSAKLLMKSAVRTFLSFSVSVGYSLVLAK
jgi:hypothetical protein